MKLFVSVTFTTEFSSYKDFRDEDEMSVATDYQDYDPAKHNPVFFGKMHSKIPIDTNPEEDVDTAIVHPSVIGYAFTEKPVKSPSPPPTPVPSKDECKFCCTAVYCFYFNSKWVLILHCNVIDT